MYQFAREFPLSIVYPSTTEDFSEFIHLCKPRLLPLLETLFSSSILASRGLIDRFALRRYYDRVIDAPFDASDTRMLGLIRLLIVETNLQNLNIG